MAPQTGYSSTTILLLVVLAVCLGMLLLAPEAESRQIQDFVPRLPTSMAVRDINSAAEAEALLAETGTKGLLLVHTPWCGHCKNMMPDYEAAAEELLSSGSPAVLARLEASQACADFLKAQDIKGFPTIIVLGSRDTTRYNAARSASALVSFVKSL